MSYGYIIATTKEVAALEKIRSSRFWLLGSESNLWFYLTMDEGGQLSRRNGAISQMTKEGVLRLTSLGCDCYFMDFLMRKKEGDLDVKRSMLIAIKGDSAILLHPELNCRLEINKTYQITQ
ncbi:hypothetical protein [Serpentinimonas maccroryi]|jgi:hypothetical protein|uniref:hypothetical protein n=1 Tax=Serpentinimonas maccroryi TaxID=1458426 RepID=UPI0020338632|nr:hypothetical protein [Serpentinimonas maccroryi]MCM2479440.1 hypothetical protein [Serpentinimonas maccroryi]